jgi:hypothetical protein
MTRAARLCALAGLTAITAMTAADASAQNCPEWLKWACPDSASSNPVARKGARQGKQLSPTNSEMGRRTEQARSERRRPSQHGERQGQRLDPALNEQEKEVLFQQFLEWEKKPRLNADTNR